MKKNTMQNSILCADIGGTNSTFALVDTSGNTSEESPKISHKKRFDTKNSINFPCLISEYTSFLHKLNIPIPRKACFAVAGPVFNNKSTLPNANLDVDGEEIMEQTPLKDVLVINDLAALGFSMVSPGPKDIKTKDIKPILKPFIKHLHPGRAHGTGKHPPTEPHPPREPFVVIAPGTGLGACAMIFDHALQSYIPLPSEAGHCDLVVKTEEELEFVEFTLKRLNLSTPASWELALSGKGLENIYTFLCSTKFKKHTPTSSLSTHGVLPSGHRPLPSEDRPLPEFIAKHRKTDAVCKETFALFERFLARFAKNMAICFLARGGVYIGGGIIARNPDMFSTIFATEFLDNQYQIDPNLKKNDPILKKMLQSIPVHAIMNYDATLYGCAKAAIVWKKKIQAYK